MTFYGLSCVFLTWPQFASLRQHSGLSCSWHVGLFSPWKLSLGPRFFRPWFGIFPGEANPFVTVLSKWAWIIQILHPACLWGTDAKKQTGPILCMVKSHCPFPKWFPLPGVVSDSLTCTSIKFWNKVERREKHIHQVSPMSQILRNTLQIHSLVKDLQVGGINLTGGDSFRRMKQIDQGHHHKWWNQVSSSHPSTAKSDCSHCAKPASIQSKQRDSKWADWNLSSPSYLQESVSLNSHFANIYLQGMSNVVGTVRGDASQVATEIFQLLEDFSLPPGRPLEMCVLQGNIDPHRGDCSPPESRVVPDTYWGGVH